jgi:P-type conjugative transfer protein TrbJ
MRHFSQLLLLAMALLSTCMNRPAWAQYGPVPVIEVGPNLAVNTTTSIEMGYQVINSTEQVRLETLLELYGRKNLRPAGGGGGDDIPGLFKRLIEALGEGESLHYELGNLKARMAARYPGYVDPGRAMPMLDGTAKASLHTLRGSLLSVREQMKLSEIIREEMIVSQLASCTSGAEGNLSVSQCGNYIGLENIRETRRLRQLVAALVNVQTVALSNQINHLSGQERAVNDWVQRSRTQATAYTGRGGFGPDNYPH